MSFVIYNAPLSAWKGNEMKWNSRGFWKLAMMCVVASFGCGQSNEGANLPIPTAPVSTQTQFIGSTFGFDYETYELTGPYPASTENYPLYNPDPSNTSLTWDTWIRQAGQAGLDFIAPNLRGAYPDATWSPALMAPVLTALNNTGFASQIKIAAFDDNAASWQAQWQMANNLPGTEPFDISNPANWTYIYDNNYKIFLETIPDANRFKIDDRPVYIVWTGNPATVGNEQGNYSKAMTYLRQKSQADFGVNPYIIVNIDALQNDTTLGAVVDAAQGWSGGGTWTLETFNNTKIGVAFPGLDASTSSTFRDPNHGITLNTALTNTVGAGALITLMEGFTDYEEDAALMQVRNLDTNGNPLSYSSTLYDYPNQRLDIVRQHSLNPFPSNLLHEAEGADYYGGAAGGNGKTNYYRNGNIAIEPTSDTGGGFDVGWMQPGEWFEWESVPLNGQPHFLVRVATSSSGRTAHFVIDGIAQPSQTLPNTGGLQNWTTYDFGAYGTYTNSYHIVRIVFDRGGANFNWWQL